MGNDGALVDGGGSLVSSDAGTLLVHIVEALMNGIEMAFLGSDSGGSSSASNGSSGDAAAGQIADGAIQNVDASGASDAGSIGKASAAGIVYLVENAAQLDAGSPFSNPNVDGVKQRLAWAAVEASPEVL